MLVVKKTNFDLVAEKDALRCKAKCMVEEGFISEDDYTRYSNLFDRLYNKTIKLAIKIELNEFNNRLENMLKLTEVILWDIVKHAQLKEIGKTNTRKYNVRCS